MLVSILPVPFGDASRQWQFEAVRAALEADADAPATVLLGNLGAFSPIQADVLVVRPTGLALGLLLPQAGLLTMPALAAGAWLLDGQPLPGWAGGDNPFAQYEQQLPVAIAWLGEHFGRPVNELPPCVGFALFEAPLTFGPAVEAQLHRAAHDFQLIGEAAQLPARLRQQLAGEVFLDENELLDWGEWLAHEPYVAHSNGIAESRSLAEGLFGNPANFLEQKLRQLWRWLGAEDIPADPPYGAPPLADQQEQARLQQLRQELQAELHQQRQEAATREAARTQELTLLRQQLAQAGPSATEREAEQRAKAALEESLRTARAELAARNSELDARIQQLGQLIGRLQAAPASTAVPALAAGSQPASNITTLPPPPPKIRPAAPARSPRRLRQAERWGLVFLVATGVGAGTWGVVRWTHRPTHQRITTAIPNSQDENSADASAPNEPDTAADSLAQMPAANSDTVATPPTQAEPATFEAPEAATQPAALHVDSAAVIVKPTLLLPGAGADSATAPTSPTP